MIGRIIIIFLLFFISVSRVDAAAPPRRDQVLLNGIWTFTPLGGSPSTMIVPSAWYWDADPRFETVSEATYERTVTIPSGWTDKRIQIEFDGVNHIANVYINNTKVIDNHIGGWIPFSADITPYVTAGTTATIRVEVKGGNHVPIVDSAGNPAWPIGWYGHRQQWGIIYGVALRAYGVVNIQNTYIQTSINNRTMEAIYTIQNSTNQSQTVTLEAVAKRTTAELSIPAQSVTIPAGSTVTKTLTQLWESPALWNPKTPNLYILESIIKQNGIILDRENVRFGFREITIVGNQIYLNGNRVNLWGDSINIHAQGFGQKYLTESSVAEIVDKILARNIRVVRSHQEPAPPYFLETADEKGLMIIDESPLYARSYLRSSNKALYLSNSLIWIKEWIIARRNHPSIVKWAAENELGPGTGYINWFTNAELLQLGAKIREFDNTRPITYEGDKEVGDVLYDQHYPEGHNNTWSWSIYMLNPVSSGKPHSIGEFLTDYGPANNKWWQGTVTRGLRYKNFSDIRPYNLFWTWDKPLNDPQVANIKNSFSPIALFDYAYDDLALAPLLGTYPTVNEGQSLTRDAVLYNDDFSDTAVTVRFEVLVNGTSYAIGQTTGTLVLGEHVRFPYTFQVPNLGGNRMTLRLSTYKNNIKTYEEDIFFTIIETGLSGSTNDIVTIGWQTPPSPSPTASAGKPGDANGDNIVDGQDYIVWLLHYGQNVSGVTNGDFNTNGTVDGLDYVIWLTNYGR